MRKKKNANNFEDEVIKRHEKVIKCIDFLISYYELHGRSTNPDIEPFDFNQMIEWLKKGQNFAEDYKSLNEIHQSQKSLEFL